MCDCITKITDTTVRAIKKKYPDAKIEHGKMLGTGFTFGDDLAVVTYNDFEYMHTSKKKDGTYGKSVRKTTSLIHSYCPFCGKKKDKI